MVDFSSHVRRGHPISFTILVLISLIVAIIASVLVHDYNSVSRARAARGDEQC